MSKNISRRVFSAILMMSIILGHSGLIEAASFTQSSKEILQTKEDAGDSGNMDNAGKHIAGVGDLDPTPHGTGKGFSADKKNAAKLKYVPGEVIVKYKPERINLKNASGKSKALAMAKNMDLGVKEAVEKSNISVLETLEGATVEETITRLEENPNVEYAQPNFQYQLSQAGDEDTRMAELWGLDNTGQTIEGIAGIADADIDAPEAWNINEGTNAAGAGGANVDIIVAVIDTGAAYEHPDLAAGMWDGSNCLDFAGAAIPGGCLHGYDFEHDDNDPLPTSSNHGTHVAGTIAATKDNGRGVAGVAPRAKVMALKTSLTSEEIIKAISFAQYNGAKVINASWGGYGETEEDSAIRDAIAGFSGLFVAAAGNDTQNHDSGDPEAKMYPSDFDLANIISVAATDNNDALADFSDYGSVSVDVGAPGEDILSTVSLASVLNEAFEYVALSGIPSGWSKGGDTTNNWGTDNIGGDYDKVMLGDLNSPYANSANTTLTTSAYDLDDTTSATVTFDSGCNTEYTDYGPDVINDYMAVEYSSDGNTFSEIDRWNEPYLDSYFELPEDPTGSIAMTFSDDVPAQYLTGNFKLRFRWVTNSSVNETGGCFVDNVEIAKMSSGAQDSYAYSSGTSMATPHVVGLAALLWGYNPGLTTAQIKDTIMNTGDSLTALDGKTLTGKRINAQKALSWLVPTASVTYSVTDITNTDVVATLTPDEEGMTITSAGGLTHTFTENGSFTFTFTDVDGNTGSATATVSNIDKIAPVIALNGNDAVNVLKNDVYAELGASVTDNHDAPFAATSAGTVDTSIVAAYTITYNATDAAGNTAAPITRAVNVVDALDSDETEITSFSLAGIAGMIDETGHTISITVPFGTDVTALAPIVMLSAGASISPASATPNNFTSAQDYTVTAENSVATQIYTVTITVAPDPDITILAADKNALTESSILGTNSDAAHITAALNDPLPALGSINATNISWTSSLPGVISNDGQTLNRPIYSEGDSNVNMTATLTKGAITDTKVFGITVIKNPASQIASVTSSAYTVGASTIAGVPYNTAKSTFLAAISKGESHQTWNETGLSDTIVSGNTLTVTAEDTVTSITYTISVNSAPSGGGGGGGGGAPTVTTVSATDKPLQVKSSQQGTLNRTLDEKNKVKLEIPKGSVNSTTTFIIEKRSLTEGDAPEAEAGAFLFSGLAFDIDAEDENGIAVKTFAKDLTITLTVSELPADTSGLKIYYYSESEKKWMLIENVTFTASTITFKVDHLTRFAVFAAIPANGELETTDSVTDGSAMISDGDIIQCKSSANPFAVYIVKAVNGKNYLRHIINLNIFNHYKHLKWGNLKQVASLSAYSMSGWVRVNTGISGSAGASDKVWEINGDQTRHWINMTAEQFLTHGGKDEAVYIINRGELDLYAVGADVKSL